MSRTIRNLVAVGSAMLLSVSLALPALAWESGTSVGGTGVSVQQSSNTAVAVQSAAAVSGPATVNGNGEAQSGDAEVELSGQQTQTNIQVGVSAAVAAAVVGAPVGVRADTTNAQEASNWAGLEQQAAAISGAAETAGDTCSREGAEAESGDAEVEAEAAQKQTNIQASANVAAFIGHFGMDRQDAATLAVDGNHFEPISVYANSLAAQTSDQTAMITQAGAATTGDAFAQAPKSEDAEAETGDAEVELEAFQHQLTVQLAANVAIPIFSNASVDSTFTAAQGSSNAADIAQDGAAVSEYATAIGADAEAESGEAEAEAEECQNQKAIQAALMLNGTFLTWTW